MSIDGESTFKMLSFRHTYSGYNQIRMSPNDAPKTTFMTNRNSYYYDVMSFGVKNSGATYQRLMETVFSNQKGENLKVYIDNMVVKTPNEG